MSEESDNFEYSDGEIDEKKHEKLVENVLNLNRAQRVKKPSRTEPTLRISEFNLVKSITGKKGSVHLSELTKVLKSRKKHEEINRKLQSTSKKSRTLPKPLEKPQVERIRRTVNYEKSRLDFDRWEALVTSNRAQLHQVFPLDSVEKIKIKQKEAENYPKTWVLKSELQKKLEKLEPKVEEYHINTEEEDKFPLTLKELKEKRKEAAKLRAHQSFKEAKARRQNKIKSKKYHRILRREKIRQSLKEFEELQKTNPEEALKKLEDIEKARAEERFSLRHKGTGQWARNKQVRAKYDKESRQVLAQQLAISRDLTQKLKVTDTDSEDEEVQEKSTFRSETDSNNPWVNGMKPAKEIVEFVSGYRKYWDEQNKNKEAVIVEENLKTDEARSQDNDDLGEAEIIEERVQEKLLVVDNNKKPKAVKRKVNTKQKKEQDKKVKKLEKSVLKADHKREVEKKNTKRTLSNSSGEWEVTADDVEDIFNKFELSLEKTLKEKLGNKQMKNNAEKKTRKKKKTKPIKTKHNVELTMPSRSKKHIIDEELIEEPHNDNQNVEDSLKDNVTDLKNKLESIEETRENNNIDPNTFFKPKPTNLTNAIPDLLSIDENEDTTDNQRDVIIEAFEDDDIVQDFTKEKADEINKDTPKDIDLNLPGWGSWAGAMIDSSKCKRKRFIIKMPEKLPRKDDNKGSLIINEKAQAKIKPHKVSEVPFPFRTVKDYEASIRAPIGNTFMPETSFKKLIQPAVVTKMGAIIEPISKNMLVNRKKT